MRKFFNNGGRYGNDTLNITLFVIALIFIILADRLQTELLLIPSYAAVIWAFCRMFSKNVFKRQSENAALLNFANKVKSSSKGRYDEFKQARSHKFYKCPQCGAKLRIPRGKGKIIVSCPKCANQFSAKS